MVTIAKDSPLIVRIHILSVTIVTRPANKSIRKNTFCIMITKDVVVLFDLTEQIVDCCYT